MKRAASDEVSEGFNTLENFPIYQIICNTGQSFARAKSTSCTHVGKIMADNFIELATTGVFADPSQAVEAIISNALDACSQRAPIGRFGIGFFSIYHFLVAGIAKKLTVVTKNAETPFEYTLEVTFADGSLRSFLTRAKTMRPPGTSVTLSGGDFQAHRQSMIKQVTKFRRYRGANIHFFKSIVNRSESAHHLHGTVEVVITQHDFQVTDDGVGMNLADVKKLLMPILPNERILTVQNPEAKVEIKVENDPMAPTASLELFVDRVCLVRMTLDNVKGFQNLVFFPDGTRIPLSRADVLLSDPQTSASLTLALARLIPVHASSGSVVHLHELVCKYAEESQQTEASNILQTFDQLLLDSGLVLAPENDAMVDLLCARFGVQTVKSKIFHLVKLEDAILAKAGNANTSLFVGRHVIELDQFEGDVMVSKNLARIVLVKPGIDGETIANSTNVDKNLLRLIARPLRIDATINSDFFGILHREFRKSAPASRTMIMHKGQILQTWFAHRSCFPDHQNIFPDFLRLWFLAEIPESALLETLAVMQKNIVQTPAKAAMYGLKSDEFAVSGLELKRAGPHRTPVKLFEAAELELKLINVKLQIFPTVSTGTLAVCFYNGPHKSGSFTELAGFLAAEGVETRFLKSLEKSNAHVVESYLSLFIFCEFAADCKKHKHLDKFSSDFCEFHLNHFSLAVRNSTSLTTLVRLYTQALAGARYDEQVLRATVLEPIRQTFPFLRAGLGARRPDIPAWVLEVPENAASYVFTVNDMMAFAFKGGFTTAHKFMAKANLTALAASALQNRGRSATQAVAIDVNFATTQDAVVGLVHELFMQAVQALRAKGVPDGATTIRVDVKKEEISFFAAAGIAKQQIMAVLLPLAGEKAQSGSDFLYAAIRQPNCAKVEITTVSAGFWCSVVATPVVKKDIVVDVGLNLQCGKPRDGEREGTLVRVAIRDSVDQVAVAAQAVQEFSATCGMTEYNVLMNGQSIDLDPTEVYSQPGVLSCFLIEEDRAMPSVVLIDSLPHGQLLPFWNQVCGRQQPDQDWLTLFFMNVVVDISVTQVKRQKRGHVSFHDLGVVQAGLQQAAVRWAVRKYARAAVNPKETGLEAFCNSVVPRTTTSGPIAQLMAAALVRFRFPEKWIPKSIQEFRTGIDAIAIKAMVQCIMGEPHDPIPEFQYALALIENLKLDETVRAALFGWFRLKGVLCHVVEEPAVERVQQAKPSQTNEHCFSMIGIFCEAYCVCLNSAIEKGHKILLTELGTAARKVQIVPKLIAVAAIDKFTEAFYEPSTHSITVSLSVMQGACVTMARAMKDLPTADHLLEFLKNSEATNSLFRARGSQQSSVLLHELVHAFTFSGHNTSPHPLLQLVDKQKGVLNTDLLYDGAIVNLDAWIIEAGFASFIFDKLNKLSLF